MSNIIVTGGSSGIGFELAKQLLMDDHSVATIDLNPVPEDIGVLEFANADVGYINHIERVAETMYCEFNFIPDILINCAGINFIDWIENTPEEQWNHIMDTNAKGIFSTTKVFMGELVKRKGTILNIVSNASHMPMTNSIAYNASKGAAHIMTLQMARELGPKGITVFGISPNRCKDTAMSDYIDSRVCDLRGWTPEFAREYQLKALPAGEETDPKVLAEFIAFLLSTKERHKYLAGTVIPYGK